MTEPPDYAALARQYLDLWEEHLTAIANDPALAAQMAAMLGLMGRMMPFTMPAATGGDPLAPLRRTMTQMAAGGMPAGPPPAGAGEDRCSDDDHARRDTRSQAGAAATAAASGDGGQRLDELAERLAALEARLDALAAGSGSGRGTPAARPGAESTGRRRKSGSVD
jgi:hypothetical protein